MTADERDAPAPLEPPQGVGMTAVGVAWIRAAESARPDGWCYDPLAKAVTEAVGWTSPTVEAFKKGDDDASRLYRWVVVRTRFLDDVVTDALDAGVRQVVIVGAGLDGRAFRIKYPPGTTVYEVDTDEVLSFKDAVLATAPQLEPRCDARVVVRADLREDWPAALVAAGFRRDEPALWIAEGLLSYLSDEENDVLLSRFRELSAPRSRLGLTFQGPSVGGGEETAAHRIVGHLWKSGPRDDPRGWLVDHGWDAEVFSAGERAAAYGRKGHADDPVPRLGRAVLVTPAS